MSTVHASEGASGCCVFAKGAPDVMLARAPTSSSAESGPLDRRARRALARANEQLADEALRTLAVAYAICRAASLAGAEPRRRRLEQKLVVVGLVGLVDPPRPEVRDAIAGRGGRHPAVMITATTRAPRAPSRRDRASTDDGRVVTGGSWSA